MFNLKDYRNFLIAFGFFVLIGWLAWLNPEGIKDLQGTAGACAVGAIGIIGARALNKKWENSTNGG